MNPLRLPRRMLRGHLRAGRLGAGGGPGVGVSLGRTAQVAWPLSRAARAGPLQPVGSRRGAELPPSAEDVAALLCRTAPALGTHRVVADVRHAFRHDAAPCSLPELLPGRAAVIQMPVVDRPRWGALKLAQVLLVLAPLFRESPVEGLRSHVAIVVGVRACCFWGGSVSSLDPGSSLPQLFLGKAAVAGRANKLDVALVTATNHVARRADQIGGPSTRCAAPETPAALRALVLRELR